MTVNTFPSWAHDEAALSGFPHISCGNVLVTEWRGCFWGKLPKPPSKLLESLDGKWESHRRARAGSRKYRLMPVIYFSQWRCFCSVTHSCSFLAEKLSLCSNFFLFLPCLCLTFNFKLWWLYRRKKHSDSNLPFPTAFFWLRSVWPQLHVGTFIYKPNK